MAVKEVYEGLRRSLQRAKRGNQLQKSLGELCAILVSLDEGMFEGQILVGDALQDAKEGALQLLLLGQKRLASVDRSLARKWHRSLAIWQRPRELNSDDLDAIVEAEPASAPEASLDLDEAGVAPAMRAALLLLRDQAKLHPSRHRLDGPAGAAELVAWEKERKLRLPEDLKQLYRVCNGFRLYCDASGRPAIALTSIGDLMTYAEILGEDEAASMEDPLENPKRICAFDLGNGAHLSCSMNRKRQSAWVDDAEEGVDAGVGIVASSVAEVLTRIFDDACFDAEAGRWTPFWLRGSDE